MTTKPGWIVLVQRPAISATYYCGHKHLSAVAADRCAGKLVRSGGVRLGYRIVRSLP